MSRKFLTPLRLPSGTTLPATGSAGDLFYKSDTQTVYAYGTSAWNIVGSGTGGGGATVTQSATPPTDTTAIWFNTEDGVIYVYYDSYWVAATGPSGNAATIAVGTVTTGTAGSSVQVTNSGTNSAVVLNFTIPQGDTGPQGATGATGPAAVQTIPFNRSGTVAVVTGTARFRFPAAATLVGASMALNTAGSSSTTVVIKKNGVALTWASALTLASSATGLAEQAISGTATVAAGDYLTVDVTAAGTGAADLSVFVRYQ